MPSNVALTSANLYGSNIKTESDLEQYLIQQNNVQFSMVDSEGVSSDNARAVSEQAARAIAQGFMTEQDWEDLINGRLRHGRVARETETSQKPRGNAASDGLTAASSRNTVDLRTDLRHDAGRDGGELFQQGKHGKGNRNTVHLKRFFHGTRASDIRAFDLRNPSRKDLAIRTPKDGE